MDDDGAVDGGEDDGAMEAGDDGGEDDGAFEEDGGEDDGVEDGVKGMCEGGKCLRFAIMHCTIGALRSQFSSEYSGRGLSLNIATKKFVFLSMQAESHAFVLFSTDTMFVKSALQYGRDDNLL